MPSATPQLQAPPGACDTHMHFYHHGYPPAAGALLTPADAWLDDYRALQARLGLQRVVIVQPTTYGRDNACQLAALAAFGDSARAVLVVDDRIDEAQLERFTALGARGARFHMLPGGAVPWELLEPVAARIAPFGWHVQLQLNGRELPEQLARLQRLPCPLVIDHVGRFTPPVAPEHAAFRALRELLDGGRCWVKLSAPYVSAPCAPPAYAEVSALARELVAAAPERMLWASNWPHPGEAGPPDEALLLDLLLAWADDGATRQRILVDNPAALYGF
ncbi:MAG TPA: amidohydrolase family protein [Gammaproteobacteria bacterium]